MKIAFVAALLPATDARKVKRRVTAKSAHELLQDKRAVQIDLIAQNLCASKKVTGTAWAEAEEIVHGWHHKDKMRVETEQPSETSNDGKKEAETEGRVVKTKVINSKTIIDDDGLSGWNVSKVTHGGDDHDMKKVPKARSDVKIVSRTNVKRNMKKTESDGDNGVDVTVTIDDTQDVAPPKPKAKVDVDTQEIVIMSYETTTTTTTTTTVTQIEQIVIDKLLEETTTTTTTLEKQPQSSA